MSRLPLVLVLVSFGCRSQPALVVDGASPPVHDTWIPPLVDTSPDQRSDGLPVTPSPTILFGDLHVHTFFSHDAFSSLLSSPTGEKRDVTEACAFARHCAGLDFFASAEHAEGLTPSSWREVTKQLQTCAADATGGARPLIPFLGFEWTQMHYKDYPTFGHRNVIFKGLTDGELPRRPIGSFGPQDALHPSALYMKYFIKQCDDKGITRYPLSEFKAYFTLPTCSVAQPSPSLPDNCYEVAYEPRDLFRKLREWGLPALVIPHGSAWGLYPAAWGAQLNPSDHDPEYQRLVEVYSQHGASEEHREYPAVSAWTDPTTEQPCSPTQPCTKNTECTDGIGMRCIGGQCEVPSCQWLCQKPPPSSPYLPCCWRAYEIVSARPICTNNPEGTLCKLQQLNARRTGIIAAEPGDDWLDCDQCPDCFEPAFNYQPGSSVQAALVQRGFPSTGGAPTAFTWGFIGSTDGHRAFPGSVKEVKEYAELLHLDTGWGEGSPLARANSYLYAGGLVAVHVQQADRDAIWEALYSRRVYGTSGARILLWFDLLADGQEHPMGSVLTLSGPPRFRVRAMGAHPDLLGCPADVAQEKGSAFVTNICSGECFWPNTAKPRRRIQRIEVIKIRRQASATDPLAPLIQDHPPFKTLDCPTDQELCEVAFEDIPVQQETIYYVRAIQEPTPSINGDPVRCQKDAAGRCIASQPCDAASSTDSCLTVASERAWSSPIYLSPQR